MPGPIRRLPLSSRFDNLKVTHRRRRPADIIISPPPRRPRVDLMLLPRPTCARLRSPRPHAARSTQSRHPRSAARAPPHFTPPCVTGWPALWLARCDFTNLMLSNYRDCDSAVAASRQLQFMPATACPAVLGTVRITVP